jgi:hypothetical protein
MLMGRAATATSGGGTVSNNPFTGDTLDFCKLQVGAQWILANNAMQLRQFATTRRSR